MSPWRGGVPRVGVVVATRDRRASLARTLPRLDVPGGPPVVVVDNGSGDGTPDLVRAAHPAVRLVALDANAGAVARTTGVRRLGTPYVAFADDDSWWEPGALDRAVDLLDRHPRLAVVVARVRLAGDGSEDRVSQKAARAPLGRSPGSPGPDVLSFPAFAAVVRREAYLATGGFSPLLFFGGEEHLLALDLAAAGWQLAFAADVVAWHAPTTGRQSPARWAQQTRNDVLVAWLRLPVRTALAGTARLAVRAPADRAAGRALAGLARRLPAALGQRRPVPDALADRFRTAQRPLDGPGRRISRRSAAGVPSGARAPRPTPGRGPRTPG